MSPRTIEALASFRFGTPDVEAQRLAVEALADNAELAARVEAMPAADAATLVGDACTRLFQFASNVMEARFRSLGLVP